MRSPVVASGSGGDDHVDGKPQRDSGAPRPLEHGPRRSEPIGLHEGASDIVPERGEERERHPAADQEPLDLGREVVHESQLVGDLGASENGPDRTLRLVEDAAERRQLPRHEQSRHRRAQVPGDGLDRGVRAVGGGERVVDVDLGQSGQGLGECRVVVLLFRMEAQVLEHQELARPEGVGRRLDLGSDAVRRQRHGLTEELGESRRRGPERVLGIGLALGAPEMRGEDHRRPGIEAMTNRRQGRGNPRVVGDARAVERDIEVHPKKDPLICKVDLFDAHLRQCRALSPDRSRRMSEKCWLER